MAWHLISYMIGFLASLMLTGCLFSRRHIKRYRDSPRLGCRWPLRWPRLSPAALFSPSRPGSKAPLGDAGLLFHGVGASHHRPRISMDNE